MSRSPSKARSAASTAPPNSEDVKHAACAEAAYEVLRIFAAIAEETPGPTWGELSALQRQRATDRARLLLAGGIPKGLRAGEDFLYLGIVRSATQPAVDGARTPATSASPRP